MLADPGIPYFHRVHTEAQVYDLIAGTRDPGERVPVCREANPLIGRGIERNGRLPLKCV